MATNNVAEYKALIGGLEMALDKGVTDLEVKIDSPVVAGHLVEGHRIRTDHLRPLIERVQELLALFSRVSVARVPRTANAHADRLANQGIDAATDDVPGGPAQVPPFDS